MGYIETKAALIAIQSCGTVEQLTAWKATYDAAIILRPSLYSLSEKSTLMNAYNNQMALVNITNQPITLGNDAQNSLPPALAVQKTGKDAVLDDLQDPSYEGMSLDDVQKYLTVQQLVKLFNGNSVERKELLLNAYSMWKDGQQRNTASQANPEIEKQYFKEEEGKINLFSLASGMAEESIGKWVKQNTTKVPGQGGNVEDPKEKKVTSVNKPAESTDAVAPVLAWGDVFFITGGIVLVAFILHAIISH